jgi:hypothetical protein
MGSGHAIKRLLTELKGKLNRAAVNPAVADIPSASGRPSSVVGSFMIL